MKLKDIRDKNGKGLLPKKIKQYTMISSNKFIDEIGELEIEVDVKKIYKAIDERLPAYNFGRVLGGYVDEGREGFINRIVQDIKADIWRVKEWEYEAHYQ